MAKIDSLTKKAREWQKLVDNYSKTLMRAAAIQAEQYCISNPALEAKQLASQYNLIYKQKVWRDYGDIAFHLISVWPPDLSYIILYSLRDIQHEIGYDPVPYVLKAIEMMYFFNPENTQLNIDMKKIDRKLFEKPEERVKSAAKILVREISCVPLRWASGVYNAIDVKVKPFVKEQLREFNPNGTEILFNSDYARFFTMTGIIKGVTKILFGKDIMKE